jgi:hypothetical protein
MSIKKFIATADATIAIAYKNDLLSTSYNSNIGAASSLELYSLFGNATTSSVEQSRILLKFPVTEISQSRAEGKLPPSGSVAFYLKLSNVEHPYSLPEKYYISVFPLGQDWDEGYGVDLDSYSDIGSTGSHGYGVTWEQAKAGSYWLTPGGHFNTSSFKYEHFINNGTENVLVNITGLIEAQISNVIQNYGLCIKLSGSYENGELGRSFYTKRFSSRETNFFYSKPCLEARWDDSISDDRNKYKTLLPGMYTNEAQNTIYFYNKPLGYLSQINTLYGNLSVKFYSDSAGTQEVLPNSITVTNPSSGIYKAVFTTTASVPYLYDWWYEGGGTNNIFYKGVIAASTQAPRDDVSYNEEKILSITNLKSSYSANEIANIKIFTRKKNWQPNIYSSALNNIESYTNSNLYYKIFRHIDNYEIIPYGTGNIPYTKTSYDKSGNYFNLDMSLLEPGYAYGIKFGLLEGSSIKELKETFRFKVE